MLPLIAQFFGVYIDDLFKSKVNAYRNEAIKWFSKYEESKNQDDFFRADLEFKKLFESNQYSRDDIRSYGLLYEYHMYYCKNKALEQYDKLLAEGTKDELYYRVCRQKILLLTRIGRGEETVSEWEIKIASGMVGVEEYSCLINACYWTKTI